MRLNLANNRETYLVYLVSSLFIVLNAVAIALEFYYFSLVPLVLLVVLVTIYSLDKLIYLAVFVIPLSCATICCVLRAIFADSCVGNASASSLEFV